MKNFFKITRLSFAVFRTACLIILLIGIALQFPSVQTLCINTLVLKKHQTIKIEGFSGLFPFYFSFEKIDLYDHDHPLLTIKNLNIDWSAWNFIRKKVLAIQKLEIDQVEYYELPSFTAEKESLTFPKIPLGYISNLKIGEAAYKTPKHIFKYTISGSSRHEENGFEFNLTLKNLKERSTVLAALIKYVNGTENNEARLTLNLTAEEHQGLLHYLVPTLEGKVNLSLQGTGPLNNFQGSLSAIMGGITISSKLHVQQDSSKEAINIFSTHKFHTKHTTYNISGLIKTNSLLNRFVFHDYMVTQHEQPYIKISGEIHRKGEFFTSNNLGIKTFISPKYTIVTAAQFNYNPYRFIIEGNLKSEFMLNKQKIAFFNIPVSANGTLDSLKILLNGAGTIPELPPAYKAYSQFNITAKLEPKSFLHDPKVKLELTSPAGKINGVFSMGSQSSFHLQGDLLSNFFQIDSYWKHGQWHLAGKNKAPVGQLWDVSDITATLKSNQSLELEGKANLKINNKNISAEFVGNLDKTLHNLNIASLRLHHQESFFESKGTINLLKEEGMFSWHLYTFNLKDFFPRTSHASGTVSLLGQLTIAPQDWALSFTGDFHKIFLDDISVNSGVISASIPLNNKNNLLISINAKKSSAYDTIIEDLELNASGTINQFSTTINMNGFTEQALKGNLAFSISDLSSVEIEASTIQLGQHKILLSHPTRVLHKDGKLIINPMEIAIDNGKLNLTGDITAESLLLKASLTNVPSQLLYNLTHGKFFLKGLINGTVQAYGSMKAPSLKLEVETSDPLYTSSLSGVFHKGSLKTVINLKSNQLNLRLEGMCPLNLSLAPLHFDLDHSRPFHMNLIAKGQLDNTQQIFDLNYDKLSGGIDANVLLYGTIDSPTSKGYINITQGSYERQNIGLKLHNINLNFNAKKGQFVLSEPVDFQDHQNNNGRIVFANLGVGRFLTPYVNTEVTFKKINFIDLPPTRRGGMSAFASGVLKANGPVNALALYLRGEISSLEKYIGETEETPIYHTNTIHRHLPVKSLKDSTTTSNSQTTYDIDFTLERKFHIFGQGLDSIWKGRLVIQGTSVAPIYKGQFVLQEGQLRILDRFFDVQRGEIFFDGDLSPTLYIESELKLQDMRVKIMLEGDTTNLQKRFVSDKNLSEQEILQKLFFNRTSTVSQSFQALNYLAASSFISSFINIGFYQQEDPIRHNQKEFISIRQKFSKRTYGKVDFGINSDSETDRVSLAAGFQPTSQTKTELTFSPNKNRLGIGLEWGHDF